MIPATIFHEPIYAQLVSTKNILGAIFKFSEEGKHDWYLLWHDYDWKDWSRWTIWIVHLDPFLFKSLGWQDSSTLDQDYLGYDPMSRIFQYDLHLIVKNLDRLIEHLDDQNAPIQSVIVVRALWATIWSWTNQSSCKGDPEAYTGLANVQPTPSPSWCWTTGLQAPPLAPPVVLLEQFSEIWLFIQSDENLSFK